MNGELAALYQSAKQYERATDLGTAEQHIELAAKWDLVAKAAQNVGQPSQRFSDRARYARERAAEMQERKNRS